MKLTPSPIADFTIATDSAAVAPERWPSRLCPPHPSPTTLARSPVLPRVTFSMPAIMGWNASLRKLDSEYDSYHVACITSHSGYQHGATRAVPGHHSPLCVPLLC